MKLKLFFLVILSFVFFQNNFSTISTDELKFKYDKEKFIKNLKINDFSYLDKKEELEEELDKALNNDKLRYITIASQGLNYGPTVFYAADYFYLGSVSDGTLEYSLMRAKINPGQAGGQNSLELIPLAPQKVYLNGVEEKKKPVEKDNPIYNKKIDLLSLQGRNVILTSFDKTSVFDSPDLEAGQRVCLIDNVNDGSSVKTNTVEINDANGKPTDKVVSLAASSDKIFAAVAPVAPVAPDTALFGGVNSGFAVLINDENKLKPINAVTGNKTENSAVELNTQAGQLIAIGQEVDLGENVDMYWDSELQRLFIGLTEVKRNDSSQPGGAVSILVGRLEDDKLIIEPVVKLDQNLFDANLISYVFGFYRVDATALRANSYKLKTMKTSTGKKYLIVNGIANNAELKNYICAFPILGKTKSDGTNVDEADIGKIADKNNLEVVVQNKAGMHLYNEENVLLGQRSSIDIPEDADIQDIFVVNDSVYVCVAEDRNSQQRESGIFRSTALFDENGNIRIWTPWQRVMGNIDKVYGAGLDINTGNYWYFTDDGNNPAIKNTVKVTQWGKGAAKTGLMGNGLTDVLSDEFIQSNAGVHQIFNFDKDTPSITRTGVGNQLSFMAALGYKKIALIKTGSGSTIFTPTQNEFKNQDPNRNVFVIQDQALNELGPICCAQVSRLQEENQGWLFAGGHNGLVVWRDANGDGWDGQPDQAAVDFANLIDNRNFSFKEIGDFSNVRKILAKNDFIYVITVDNIYRFAMGANKFNDVVTNMLDEKTITPPPGYLLDSIIFYDNANTVRLLVATTSGLYYSDDINNMNENKSPNWNPVTLNSGAELLNPVVHLNFLSSTKGGETVNGNLYALSADLSLNLAKLYRFDINNGIITPIKEVVGTDYFYSFGRLKTNFVTDGSLGYATLPKHFGSTNFLEFIRMTSDQNLIRNFQKNINLDLSDNAYNVGILTQNTASGGLVVPGDWGIRVNE